jgi:cytochrome P450
MMELSVLDSFHTLRNLFKKKSVHSRMKWDFATPFLAYNVLWRKHRKLFHEYFQPNIVSNYLPIQRREVHTFLRRLLVTPDNFLHHIRQ